MVWVIVMASIVVPVFIYLTLRPLRPRNPGYTGCGDIEEPLPEAFERIEYQHSDHSPHP